MYSSPGPLQKKASVFGIEHHRMTVNMPRGSRFCIRLYENPGSGNRWNVNHTSDLKVIDSWYVPSMPVREKSGGMHMWSILAVGVGEQIFRAVYQRDAGDTLRQPIIYQIIVRVL
jgi:predicted secreted protein